MKTLYLTAAKAPAVHHSTIGRLVDLYAKAAQSVRHGGDAVALLDAQFLEPRKRCFALRRRGRDEQGREFVDSQRHEFGINGATHKAG